MKWFTTLRNNQALADGLALDFPLLADAQQANRRGSTVTRIIIDQWVRNDVQQTFKIADFGIVWAHSQAVATTAALPDPGLEDDRADWLVRFRMVNQMDATTSGTQQIAHKMMDIRSQRICRSDEDELTYIMKDSGSGNGGLFVTFSIRVLLKLP